MAYKTYKKIKKCIKVGCDKNVEEGQFFCEEHQTMKHKTVLKNNNPKGFNKHIKNPEPTPPALNQEQQFTQLEKHKQFEEIQQLGNKIWREGREIFKMKKKFSMMNKVYFGFNFKDNEEE